jgi:hypothetical protein
VDKDKATRVVITCLRCDLEVRVTTENGGLELSYDIDHWQKRCCCSHLLSPADCCSFPTLERVPSTWPRSPI